MESDPFLNLRKVNTIITPVRILAMFDAGPRKHTLDNFGDLGERMVQVVVTHIEDFPVHGAQRCVEKQQDRLGEVPDVNERPPLLTIVNGDSAVLHRLRGKKVHNQVEPWPVRKSEDRGKPHDHGMKARTGAFQQYLFGRHFRFSIQGNWLHLRVFVHEFIGSAVDAAT